MSSPKTAQGSKSSPISFTSSLVVTIRVGTAPTIESFVAHESFLTSRSEFFRRAMNGNWEESKTRIINIPDDHYGTFALYISFIYTGQRPVTDKTAQELKMLSEDEFSKLTTAQYKAVFSVLILAEKLQDLKTKNAMMEAAVATALMRGPDGDWFVPSSCVINNIYRGTPPKSPARRFVTDAWIGCSISESFAIISRLNKDFVEDLGKGIDKHWVAVRMQATFQSTIWNAAAYQEKSNED